MHELTRTERTLHDTVEELVVTDGIGSDDATYPRYFHDRIGPLVAELRSCREYTSHR